jgi:hypothetical protein
MDAKLLGHQRRQVVRVASMPAAEFEAAMEGDDLATAMALAEMSSATVVAVGAGPEHRRRLSDWPHVSSKFTTSTVQSS